MQTTTDIFTQESKLNNFFTSEKVYVVPAYQRPYMWAEGETEQLFDDLQAAHARASTGMHPEKYFLGSMVLVRQFQNTSQDKGELEIVDGQQRLTTLTILLATAATLFSDEERKSLIHAKIRRPGDLFIGLEAMPRLRLRQADRAFFNHHIQELNLDELLTAETRALKTDAQRRIQKNSALLQESLRQKFITGKKDPDAQLSAFITFLLTQCYAVVMIAQHTESALRVFTAPNSRGLNLRTTDLLKTEVMGALPPPQQSEFSQKWEELETRVDGVKNGGFDGMLSHMRMIHARAKQRDPLLDEIRAHIPFHGKHAGNFMDKVLPPHAEAYLTIKGAAYLSDQEAIDKEINTLLKWLNLIDNSDWIPPAMAYLAHNQDKAPEALRFLTRLERLAASLFIRGTPPGKRITAYIDVLKALRRSDYTYATDVETALDLPRQAIEETKAALNGDIYLLPPAHRKYILQRLESFRTDQPTTAPDSAIPTIEHVLPQNPDPNSKWMDESLWTAEQRAEWCHRLANLIPIARRRNSKASNTDFAKKKKAYKAGNHLLPSSTLAQDALNEKEWTPTTVRTRQEKLLSTLTAGWNLD